MKTQKKKYYHEGDGIIREVIISESNLRKDKIKKIKTEKNEKNN